MMGSLLYLIASHLDVAFSIEVCVGCLAKPNESHLAIVKQVLRYINSTSNFSLWYTKYSNSHLAEYIVAD